MLFIISHLNGFMNQSYKEKTAIKMFFQGNNSQTFSPPVSLLIFLPYSYPPIEKVIIKVVGGMGRTIQGSRWPPARLTMLVVMTTAATVTGHWPCPGCRVRPCTHITR